MAGSRLLLNHRGILLRSLVNGVDRLIYLGERGRLFARGIGDRYDIGVDVAHLFRDFLQGRARFGNKANAVFNLRARRVDQTLDFLCGSRRALRKFANFLRNHGKTLACFACAGSFHACIQRKQIGLKGNLVDNADNIRNLTRRFFDLVHGTDRIAHNLT